MGNLLTSYKYQDHNDCCDICKSNKIIYEDSYGVKKHGIYQTSFYYRCENQHKFFINRLLSPVMNPNTIMS